MTKSILVSGASGFVGQALCAELLKRGHSVRAALRSPSGFNVASCETTKVSDIAENTSWIDALRDINTVIHLAARVHVMKDSSADPLAEFLKVNLHGTVNLVEQAARAGVKRLIYVSSVKVNGERTLSSNSALAGGNCGRGAFTESDRPNPQDPYAVSKWHAEQALQRIAQETGLEVVIVRPPLVYGPGVKGNFIRLLAAINRGIPLPLAGARNARSLIYVGNLVDALITCATHPAAAGQTYLVSDGHGVSTAELVKKIAHALGHPDRSFYLPPALLRAAAVLLGRADQVDRLFDSLCVNDSKIRGELSWLPPYSMEQGLRETANWFLGEQPIG